MAGFMAKIASVLDVHSYNMAATKGNESKKKTSASFRMISAPIVSPEAPVVQATATTHTTKDPINVTKMNYPIDIFTEMLDEFELSMEIRDRLTRTECKVFDKTFVTKAKILPKLSVEGPHYSQLKALRRITKARVFLKKFMPAATEDMNKVVWNLLVELSGGSIQQAPVSCPDTATSTEASTLDVRATMDVSAITMGAAVLRRGSRQKLYLRFNDEEGCIAIKGFNTKESHELSDKTIVYSDVKAVGDISKNAIVVGFKEGQEMMMELRDESDADLLVRKIAVMSGVTAYTARYME